MPTNYVLVPFRTFKKMCEHNVDCFCYHNRMENFRNFKEPELLKCSSKNCPYGKEDIYHPVDILYRSC